MPRTATTPSKPTGSRPGTSVATTSAAPASSPLPASRLNGNVKKGKSPKARTSNGKSDLEAERELRRNIYIPRRPRLATVVKSLVHL
ncbi:hypothetical protein BGZ89_007191, partial [Linnemannia elongata]